MEIKNKKIIFKKDYPVVYCGKKLISFPKQGESQKDYQITTANDTEYAEFDTYDEAKAFVESKGLSYKEPEMYDDVTHEV